MSLYLKKRSLHVETREEVKASIKGKESQGREGEEEKSYEKENEMDLMLLGLSPRTQTPRATPM